MLNIVKVVYSTMSDAYNIVPVAHGTEWQEGRQNVRFEPGPICRVPVVYGRTREQAERLANWIVQCINAGIAFDGLPVEDWADSHGIRIAPATKS